MTMDTAIRALLVQDAAVAALVVARVYPSQFPPAGEVPAVTYEVQSDDTHVTYDGPSRLVISGYAIDCWGASYDRAVELAGAVKVVLNGYRGLVGDTRIHLADLTGRVDVYEDQVKRWRRTLLFNFGYVEN